MLHSLFGVRGRYAPSPTGDLHLGNVRTALLAWLATRRAGGTFLVRIEDLDRHRTRPGATANILADLRWLGVDWDEGPDVGGPFGPYRQSERAAIYDAALARLRTQGLLYPCYCSRATVSAAHRNPRVERIALAPHGRSDDPPPYPGTCRNLSLAARRSHDSSGRRPAWRVRVQPGIITFTDGLAGPQAQDVARDIGDFIVRRSDGIIAYQLAVTVDDGLMGITEVVRGADLLASTARQILLLQALGYAIPTYTHLPLLTDAQGNKLSKRAHVAGISPARLAGEAAAIIVGQLAASAGLRSTPTPITAQELLTEIRAGRIHG